MSTCALGAPVNSLSRLHNYQTIFCNLLKGVSIAGFAGSAASVLRFAVPGFFLLWLIVCIFFTGPGFCWSVS